MKTNVILNINSTQTYFDDETEKVELVTEGLMRKKNDKFYIQYDESKLLDAKDVKTTLKVSAENITLIRTGDRPAHLIFTENGHHIGLYNTIMGDMTLSVRTKKIDFDINDDKFRLYLEYYIEINHETSAFHTFEMIIKDKE